MKKIFTFLFLFVLIFRAFGEKNDKSTKNNMTDCTVIGTNNPTTTVDYLPGAKIGNSFTACSSGYITSISFYMDTDGVNGGNKNTGTHNVLFGTGSNPMTSSLANALTLIGTIATVNGSGGKVTLTLESPISVTAGNVYAVGVDIGGSGLFSMDRGDDDMAGGNYFEIFNGTFNTYMMDLDFDVEISTLPTIGLIGQLNISTVLSDAQSNQILVLGQNNVIKKRNISTIVSNELPTTAQSGVMNDDQANQVLVLDPNNIIKKRTIASFNELPASPQNGSMVYFNGTSWQLVPAGQQGQTLTFCGGVPTWGACPVVASCNISSLNTVNSGMSFWPPPTMDISLGNTFTACKTGLLTSISIKMVGNGGFQPNQNTGTHTIKFGAGAIPMTETAFNALTTVGTISTVSGGGIFTLTLANPINVVQGNIYAFSLTIAGDGLFTISSGSGRSDVEGGGFFVYDPQNTFTNWGPVEDLGFSVVIN